MRAWPTRVVINPAGEVLGKVTGEGKYDLFDQTISKLLSDHKAILDPQLYHFNWNVNVSMHHF